MVRRFLAPAMRLSLLAGLLLTAMSVRGATAKPLSFADNPILAPCSRFDAVYDQIPFHSDNFDDWPESYHRAVGSVVQEFVDSLQSKGKFQCDAPTQESTLPAGMRLEELMRKLPTWKGISDSEKLSRTQIGLALLEFLNVYECALHERLFFLANDAREMMTEKDKDAEITYSSLSVEMTKEYAVISRELTSARPALERTLSVLGGIQRFLPLQTELTCTERASLDIRNALSLAAETSACMPRTWNAKDPLRDLPKK